MEPYGRYVDHTRNSKTVSGNTIVLEHILHNALHGYTYVVSIDYQGLGSFDVSSQKVEKYL
jgi:hypothetical protein